MGYFKRSSDQFVNDFKAKLQEILHEFTESIKFTDINEFDAICALEAELEAANKNMEKYRSSMQSKRFRFWARSKKFHHSFWYFGPPCRPVGPTQPRLCGKAIHEQRECLHLIKDHFTSAKCHGENFDYTKLSEKKRFAKKTKY